MPKARPGVDREWDGVSQMDESVVMAMVISGLKIHAAWYIGFHIRGVIIDGIVGETEGRWKVWLHLTLLTD
jgi:hypothetical protein